MTNLRARLRTFVQWPWHPLLLGALPVLQFWQKNFRLLELHHGLRLVAAAAVMALALLGLLRLALRDWGRAGLVTAPLMLVLVKGQAMGGAASIGCVAAAVVLLALLRWRRPDVTPATVALNAAALTLLLLPVAVKMRTDAADLAPRIRRGQRPPAVRALERPGLPDVYFILVDGLGQPATVRALFNIRPGTLTDGLRRRGAHVLRGNVANYPQTALSLASTLNLAPVPTLLDIRDPKSRDRRPLAELVADSRVARTFRKAGYRIVTYPSGYPLTRFGRPDERHEPFLGLNFMEFYVLNDGVIPLLLRAVGKPAAAFQNAQHRRRLDYIFDHLADARAGVPDGEPVFVFAHLLTPHPPFVFGPGGAPIDTGGLFSFGDGNDWTLANPGETVPYGVYWKNQASWVMERLAQTVDAIRAASPRPPVIIIQGDHGPGSQLDWDRPGASNLTERFGIFSAWFLPPDLQLPIRDGMTAMATFPVLFNGLFGEPYPTLEEGLWFARMTYPYEYYEAAPAP
ncbi:MAG TPA: hypothetical protein PLQ13_13465 [Candidatus Krumholzibacteria bacterium]|nr:hypothetical protein [Candidatus Krumholzibacteria bacterium]